LNLTSEQLKKLEIKHKLVLRLISGEKVRKVLSALGLSYGVEWCSRLKKRYEEKGLEGLIDRRRGVRYKAMAGITEWIKREKVVNPDIRREELVRLIKGRYDINISKGHISRLSSELGVINLVGRPRKWDKFDKKLGVYIDVAGAYFLKGADLDMGGTEAITGTVMNKVKQVIESEGEIPSIRTLVSDKETIQKKNETLLYLPVFGLSRPRELDSYYRRGLGVIVGLDRRYKYQTIDKHLRELEKLEVAKELAKELAKCYVEVWYIKVKLEDERCFYIDGHAKTVWTDANIPLVYHTTKKKMEKGVEQYFIHSSKGHPLILKECPGDTRLTKAMFSLIDSFENAVGKRIVEIVVFDREGLCIEVFKEFDDRKRYFITCLRSNQYKGLDNFELKSDFVEFKKDDKGNVTQEIADADITLKDRQTKGEYKLRVALIRNLARRKLIAIVTNIKREQDREISRVARRYYARWPNEENIYRDMMNIYLDKNAGYKKKEVENRTVLRKKEELETNLRGIKKKLEKINKNIEQLENEIKAVKDVYAREKKEQRSERRNLSFRILHCVKIREKQKLLEELEFKEEMLMKILDRYHKHISELERQREKRIIYRGSLLTQKENKEKELKSLDLSEKMYEINSEKNEIMTNFRTLLNNLNRYVAEHYFPPKYERAELRTMCNKFYRQNGYVKVRKRYIKVLLDPYDEPELQKDVEYACAKFNCSDVQTSTGQRYYMEVARSS